jgi:spore protease
VAAGVLGSTGVESGVTPARRGEKIAPSCVIAADALASRSLSRVCTTVQIADSGIVPGSGVGNSRAEVSRATLGVPVIAVGVPTVVDAATLASDVAAEAGAAELEPEALRTAAKGLLVTPRDIDAQVASLSRVVGLGISLALQDMELEEITALLS